MQQRKIQLHPHLKSFIRSVVMAEMSNIGPSKNYLYKEELCRAVQAYVMENLDKISSKEELEKIIDEKTKLLQQDMVVVLEMISNTMKNVPLEVLKKIR